MIDRLAVRAHPGRVPLAHQHWDKLLFLHWPLPAETIRPLVPPGLEIDTFDGTAWIGLTPFTLWGTRPSFLPAVPLLSSSHELNVRTYVHLDGVPGVWFLSLEASNALAVAGARLAYYLPYYRARMELREEAGVVHYTSHRTHPSAPPADFEASWRWGEPLGEAVPGTLDFFLIERYCLYAERAGRLYRARIFHRPWPLRAAQLTELRTTLFTAHGLPTPPGEPLVHAQAAPLHVRIWPRRRVR